MNRVFNKGITSAIRGQVQVMPKRTNYPYDYRVTVTKPVVRIPFGEKVFWGIFMGVAIMSVPAWVMYHHREYMGVEGGEEGSEE